MRAVSILSVADPAAWEGLSVEAYLEGSPSDTERIVADESGLLDALQGSRAL